jgi:hypothetical protein
MNQTDDGQTHRRPGILGGQWIYSEAGETAEGQKDFSHDDCFQSCDVRSKKAKFPPLINLQAANPAHEWELKNGENRACANQNTKDYDDNFLNYSHNTKVYHHKQEFYSHN